MIKTKTYDQLNFFEKAHLHMFRLSDAFHTLPWAKGLATGNPISDPRYEQVPGSPVLYDTNGSGNPMQET